MRILFGILIGIPLGAVLFVKMIATANDAGRKRATQENETTNIQNFMENYRKSGL